MRKWTIAVCSALLAGVAGLLAVALTSGNAPSRGSSPMTPSAFMQAVTQLGIDSGHHLVSPEVFCSQSGNLFTSPLPRAQFDRLSPRDRSA